MQAGIGGAGVFAKAQHNAALVGLNLVNRIVNPERRQQGQWQKP